MQDKHGLLNDLVTLGILTLFVACLIAVFRIRAVSLDIKIFFAGFVPRYIQIANDLLFLFLVLSVQIVVHSGASRSAQLFPPNSARLSDRGRVATITTAVIICIYQNFGTWLRMLRFQLECLRIDIKKKQRSTPFQLVVYSEEQYAKLHTRSIKTYKSPSHMQVSGLERSEQNMNNVVIKPRRAGPFRLGIPIRPTATHR